MSRSRDDSRKVCDFCSNEIPRNYYECNFCGLRHCSDHRLPESHDCLGLKSAETATLDQYANSDASPNQILSKSNDAARNTETADQVANHLAEEDVPDLEEYEEDESVAYDTVDPLVYSTTPEPDFDSSPDVNIDGTVDRGSDVDDSEQVRDDGSSMLGVLVLMLLVVVGIAALAYFSGLQ